MNLVSALLLYFNALQCLNRKAYKIICGIYRFAKLLNEQGCILVYQCDKVFQFH